MIATMIDLDEIQATLLIIVIEKDNLERMKNADPISLESRQRGGVLIEPGYPANLSLLIAYEENDAELYRFARERDMAGLIRYLERGRKFISGLDGKENTIKL